MDTFLQHSSCYKRQLCPQFSQLGFLSLEWKEKPVCQSTCWGANFRAWRMSEVKGKGTLRIQALSWCCVCQPVTGWVCRDEFTRQGRARWTPAFLWKCVKRGRASCVDIKILDYWEVRRYQKSLHQLREWVGGPANLAVGSTGTGLARWEVGNRHLPPSLEWLTALSAPSMAVLTSSWAWKEFFIWGASLSILEWGEQRNCWFSGHGFLKAKLSLPEIRVWKNLIGEFLELQAKQ